MDDFDEFLLRQRQRLSWRLTSSVNRVKKAREPQYDLEIRKQPGTNFCISRPTSAEKDNVDPATY